MALVLFWAVLLVFLVWGRDVSAFLATSLVFAASAGASVLGSVIVFGFPRRLGKGIALLSVTLAIAVSTLVLEQRVLGWPAWSGLAGCVLLGFLPRRGSPFAAEAERITFLAIAWLGFAARGGGAALVVLLPMLQGLEVLVRLGWGWRLRGLRARRLQQAALALALGSLAPGLGIGSDWCFGLALLAVLVRSLACRATPLGAASKVR